MESGQQQPPQGALNKRLLHLRGSAMLWTGSSRSLLSRAWKRCGLLAADLAANTGGLGFSADYKSLDNVGSSACKLEW